MSFVSANPTMSEVLPESHWAFFSFVPKDLPWAEWLYFTLHGYPVPAALAVRATRFGFPLPDSISVFPDPNDPAHREHLGCEISRARWLVVVVSPHSAHDPQIDEHILAFKRAGGEERIIALVVEGEPPATSTLYVKSENREWLPRWLQWRLGRDGGFVEADRSEPVIIDARPGYASLDDVMTTLISVLLDVPREELELLEALTKDHSDYAEASVLSAREKLIAAALADLEEEAPRGSSGVENERPHTDSVRRPGFILGLSGGLIIATILAVVAWRNADMERSAGDTSSPQTLTPPASEIAAPVQPESEQPLAVVEAAASSEAKPFKLSPPEVPLEMPAEASVDVAEPLQVEDPKPSFTAEETQPPTPPERSSADRSRELQIAIEATTSRAEILLDRGQYEDAAAAFEEAIQTTHSLAAQPGAASSSYLRIAGLCRTLGALQMRIASDAEARSTFEQGLKALAKVKGAKEVVRERSRLKVELDALLRRLKTHEGD